MGVEKLKRKILLTLCGLVYSGIPGLYKTFYNQQSSNAYLVENQ